MCYYSEYDIMQRILYAMLKEIVFLINPCIFWGYKFLFVLILNFYPFSFG